MNFADVSAPRAAFQRAAKFTEFARGADGVDLHATVAQVSSIAAQMQTLRDSLREITVTHALHRSRDKKSLGLFTIGHKRGDCSRGRILVAVQA